MAFVRGRLRRPWAVALVVTISLVVSYLIAAPPAADLAAAAYRSDLFARVGFATWDTGWYAAHGHWLPGYSLLSPTLGALLGVRVLLALSALAAGMLFALIAERVFELTAARVAAALFALGFCVGLLSGRVPYDLGFAIGLGAVLALMLGRLAPALGLAVLTSVASPVAGAFLALAALGGALGSALSDAGLIQARTHIHSPPKEDNDQGVEDNHGPSTFHQGAGHFLAVVAAALTPILVLSTAYPEGGYEPFAASAFWPALTGVALIALVLPQGPLTARAWGVMRAGAALYALALVGAFAIHTPVGGNAARLGPLLAAPLLAGVLWDKRRTTLLLLAPVLLYWQLVTPIRDYSSIAGDPSTHASYYAPLLSELRRLSADRSAHDASRMGYRSPGDGTSTIVEVPLTKAHWEAAYLAGHDGISLARGWERQLDTRYAALFYKTTLSATAYRAWLLQNKVAYVALPDAPLDRAGRLEAALIEGGTGATTKRQDRPATNAKTGRQLPYLRELWRSQHWRLYRFMG